MLQICTPGPNSTLLHKGRQKRLHGRLLEYTKMFVGIFPLGMNTIVLCEDMGKGSGNWM